MSQKRDAAKGVGVNDVGEDPNVYRESYWRIPHDSKITNTNIIAEKTYFHFNVN